MHVVQERTYNDSTTAYQSLYVALKRPILTDSNRYYLNLIAPTVREPFSDV